MNSYTLRRYLWFTGRLLGISWWFLYSCSFLKNVRSLTSLASIFKAPCYKVYLLLSGEHSLCCCKFSSASTRCLVFRYLSQLPMLLFWYQVHQASKCFPCSQLFTFVLCLYKQLIKLKDEKYEPRNFSNVIWVRHLNSPVFSLR